MPHYQEDNLELDDMIDLNHKVTLPQSNKKSSSISTSLYMHTICEDKNSSEEEEEYEKKQDIKDVVFSIGDDEVHHIGLDQSSFSSSDEVCGHVVTLLYDVFESILTRLTFVKEQ